MTRVERRSLSPRTRIPANSFEFQILRFVSVTIAIAFLAIQCSKSKDGMVKMIAAFDFEGKMGGNGDGNDITHTVDTNTFKESKEEKLERVVVEYGPVRNIALLGERNSGTTWMTDELRNCFESEGIEVRSGLTRDKHFFQYDEDYDEKDPTYYRHHNAASDVKLRRSSTLVVAVLRNPYAWAAAMQRRPHHSPNHLRLSMEEFLTRPWTMERPQRDLVYEDLEGMSCQLGYSYKEIVPCVRTKHDYVERDGRKPNYSARDPQYELRQDGSGLPYDSILDMRQAKIENILSIESWNWVASLEVLRYEDLLQNGTEAFLRYVEDVTGKKMKCKPSPPAPERLSSYKLEPKIKKLIDGKLNWEIEEMVGYEKS